MVRTTNGSGCLVFYTELRCFGIEFGTINCNGHQVVRQHLPFVARVTKRMKPDRFGAAIRMLKVEQIVADLFGGDDSSFCVRYSHLSFGSRNRAAAKNVDFKTGVLGRSGSRTPSMGVLLWGESPLCLVPVFLMGVMIPNEGA